MISTQFVTMGPATIIERFVLSHDDLTDADGSQTITLKALSKGTIIKGIRIKHSTAFTGGGASSCTCSVGSAAGAVNSFAAAFDIFQAVADTTAQMTSGWKANTYAADTLQATIDADVDVADLTAGVVNIDVEYWMFPDLTATGIPAGTGGGYL